MRTWKMRRAGVKKSKFSGTATTKKATVNGNGDDAMTNQESLAATTGTTVAPDTSGMTEEQQAEHKVAVSEIFYSIEGEGLLAGFPTVFVRTFGCNFTCSGFSNPTGIPQAVTNLSRLEDFRPLPTGCDSVYAWGKEYAHLQVKMTPDMMVERILDTLPNRNWPLGRVKPVLSLTGGEPTLHQKYWEQFLKHPFMDRVNKIIIETNASMPLTVNFLDALNDWRQRAGDGLVLWANSPKLSVSGETWDRSIRPDVICQQRAVSDFQYFKFVSDGSPENIAEVKKATAEYEKALLAAGHYGIDESMILLMPMGGQLEQQQAIHQQVARACLDNGYVFCGRVHVYVYGNIIGT